MFSNHKGEFKYLKKQPVRTGLLTLILLLMCAGVFMIGYINKGDAKNIFTVVAVLGMLPVAKLIVSFIMYIRAEKYSCKEELKDEIFEIVGDKKICLGFDFYLTSYKVNFPLLSAFVYALALFFLLSFLFLLIPFSMIPFFLCLFWIHLLFWVILAFLPYIYTTLN